MFQPEMSQDQRTKVITKKQNIQGPKLKTIFLQGGPLLVINGVMGPLVMAL